MPRHFSEKGFTLIEMLVIAPIVILAIGAFLTVIISMTGQVLSSRGSNALAYDVQDAMNRIEQDVKLSTTFLATNNVTLTASEQQGYDNLAANFTNVDSVKGPSLILNMLATTNNPISTTSSLVYLTDQPNACASAQLKDNTPMTFNIVYFIKDNTLWRRTIMPSNYANTGVRCAAPWQQPSCAPNYTSSFCKTNDIKLVQDVTANDFSIQYFTTAGDTIPNTDASSTSASIQDRSKALQSTPTANISLTAHTTVAGRAIERSASIRATRLDTNASTIATLTTPTTPVQPKVTSTTTAPANAVFTWNAVDGATGYNFRYNIDGDTSAWQTGLTNQNIRSFTVPAPYNGAVVNAEVVAVNSAGTSPVTTNSVTIPIWMPLFLGNNWVAYSTQFTIPAYTKTKAGMVVLKGMLKAGAGTIAILPAGYRPSERVLFENSSNQTFGRMDVQITGAIDMVTGSNAWTSLDGINFMPDGTNFTNIVSFSNGWVNFGAAHATAAYMKDTDGRVHLKGLVKSGTATSGTPIFNLPVGYRPAEYSHLVNVNSEVQSHISVVGTSGDVLAKGGSNGYLSLMGVYFPSGRATGTSCTTQWCALPLVNGWAHYAAPYSTPQFTKSADGMVHIKGLVAAGAAGVMANIPAGGYCPKEQLLLTAANASGWGRIDITPGSGSGCTIVSSVVSSTWTSFDSISYMGEW